MTPEGDPVGPTRAQLASLALIMIAGCALSVYAIIRGTRASDDVDYVLVALGVVGFVSAVGMLHHVWRHHFRR